MIRFAATIFLSAFLLFQVQPMIGKFILPWFGGGPSVWTTCLLFFQVLLLAGYTYAHLITRLAGRVQVVLHISLVAASILALPIIPDAGTWKPADPGDPTLRILLLLLVTVGPPYLLLSSTGPLLQRWFHQKFPDRSPYRLYALSNAGSLIALLSYPFVFEPWIDVTRQAWAWSAAYIFFAAGVLVAGATVFRMQRGAPKKNSDPMQPIKKKRKQEKVSGRKPAGSRILLWLGLSASASALLMATTNQVSLEISVVPFLWILPLSLYLLSFIISFDSPRWYDRGIFGPILVVSTVGSSTILGAGHDYLIWVQLALLLVVLFAACMTCHGELYRLRPHPRHLTQFYLVIASGGALGGALVAIGAPLLFNGFWEFHIAIGAACSFTLIAWVSDKFGGGDRRTLVFGLPLFVGLIAFFVVLVGKVREENIESIHVSRNFYGVLRIQESVDGVDFFREMLHGQTSHGFQYQSDSLRTIPTAYYAPDSGIGRTLLFHPKRDYPEPADTSLRVGLVGLGTGTLAAYAQEDDVFRFYEIDPDVIATARRYFTYLSDSAGTIQIVEGDARIVLEREIAENNRGEFDVLAIDAFSSDSIPAHLLTAEAADIYWSHLKENGILMLHVSNQYLNLIPVCLGLAQHLGCRAAMMTTDDNEELGQYASDWMVLTNNEEFLSQGEIQEATLTVVGVKPLLWTDRYASLWKTVITER